eukprot:11784-Heterococcus_DN1.PRE.2
MPSFSGAPVVGGDACILGILVGEVDRSSKQARWNVQQQQQQQQQQASTISMSSSTTAATATA